MTHCENCGDVIVYRQDVWVHETSPRDFNPAFCVSAVSEGVPDGGDYSSASPCTDMQCTADPCPGELPWWKEYVKEGA